MVADTPDPARQSTPKPPPSNQRDMWGYLGLGAQLAVTVLLFAGLGGWLDQRYGWSPWGLLTLGMLGVAAGLYHFLKDALR